MVAKLHGNSSECQKLLQSPKQRIKEPSAAVQKTAIALQFLFKEPAIVNINTKCVCIVCVRACVRACVHACVHVCVKRERRAA